jgi:cytoskeletal protein RodZ
MLTPLNNQKPFVKPAIVASPPSRALANYAKASETTVTGPTDTVELSEKAKDKPMSSSTMRKVGTYVALGLSFVGILGAVGCSGGATATANSQPETESVQDSASVKTDNVDLAKEQKSEAAPNESPAPNVLDGISREGNRIKEKFKGKNAEEVAETIGQESRKVGQDVVEELKTEGQRLKETFKDKDAEEIAETIGQEGRRIGKQIGEEGKKVGEEAVKVGKEIGKIGKGFWRGLTGKDKK